MLIRYVYHLKVYHGNFWPLEWTVSHRPENACYSKLVCVKSMKEKVRKLLFSFFRFKDILILLEAFWGDLI